ncbi:MAG: pantoate--beta-alanine ligase [Clostridia bacterium]|nr:pantoate--beta-alanine ligase [Clostridia bacterium]
MRIIEKISDIKAVIKEYKKFCKTVGFVPTMGYLHEGHLSLVRASKSQNDITIMSIFVNPTQFGPSEDFSKYPRDMERDSRLAEESGVDIIFAPTVEEMYPDGYKTYVNVETITEVLCGKSRPGHFKGVTTVVNKLFNIIEPDRAYFGQKDAQQVIVIKKMVRDLNMNLEIVTCPIVREQDGLAMSSRNVYLSPEERKAALILSQSLQEAQNLILKGEKSRAKVIEIIKSRISCEKLAKIDYVQMLDAKDLKDIELIGGSILIALAVKFGSTRLIDNVMMEV